MKKLQPTISGDDPNKFGKENSIIPGLGMVQSQTDFEFFHFFIEKKKYMKSPIFHHYVNLVKMKNVPFPFWIFPERHSSFLRRSNNVSKGYSTW